MNATQQIITDLEAAFADLDSAYVSNSVAWAKGRFEAMKARKREMGIKIDYEELFQISGGKTWYTIFDGRSWEMVEQIATKNAEAVITKRNASIASKLIKAGIVEVTSKTFELSKDGFNGSYGVMTNAGAKVVNIETIIAGGYNIQALHQRTLVKVK